jgi:hypothetical protein
MHRQPPSPARSTNQNQADSEIPLRFNRKGKCSSYHVEPIPVAAEASLGSDAFLWGLDLFNHGYYWEAHEAREGLWQVADRDGTLRRLFKGLILLSAAGVKIRERKNAAAARHAMRAAAQLRQLMKVPDRAFERALGMSPAALAECAEAATRIPR